MPVGSPRQSPRVLPKRHSNPSSGAADASSVSVISSGASRILKILEEEAARSGGGQASSDKEGHFDVSYSINCSSTSDGTGCSSDESGDDATSQRDSALSENRITAVAVQSTALLRDSANARSSPPPSSAGESSSESSYDSESGAGSTEQSADVAVDPTPLTTIYDAALCNTINAEREAEGSSSSGSSGSLETEDSFVLVGGMPSNAPPCTALVLSAAAAADH